MRNFYHEDLVRHFVDLNVGDFFTSEDISDVVFMKTQHIREDKFDEIAEEYNAVSLDNGTFVFFEHFAEVIPFVGTIVNR